MSELIEVAELGWKGACELIREHPSERTTIKISRTHNDQALSRTKLIFGAYSHVSAARLPSSGGMVPVS